MLFWVIVSNNGLSEIFYGQESDARKAAEKALYGPFSNRKEAKGCLGNLSSTEGEVKAIAEKNCVPMTTEEKLDKEEERPEEETEGKPKTKVWPKKSSKKK